MNKLLSTFSFLIVSLLFSCGDVSNTTQKPTNTNPIPIDSTKTVEKEEDQKLYSWLEDLRVRVKPEKAAKVVAELGVGEPVTYLNEKTEFTSKVNIRGQNLEEPWLKIKTRDGIEGWVFGGGLKVYEVTAPSFGNSPFSKCFSRFGIAYRDCIEQTRQKQLRKNRSLVQENEEGTTLKLLGGEQHQFSNSDISAFNFLQYTPEIGYYLLKEKTESTTIYHLINDKTAKQTTLIGFPEIHPEGTYLASVSTPKIQPSKLEVLEMQKGKWISIFEMEEEEAILFNPIWSEDGKQLSYQLKAGSGIRTEKMTLEEFKLSE